MSRYRGRGRDNTVGGNGIGTGGDGRVKEVMYETNEMAAGTNEVVAAGQEVTRMRIGVDGGCGAAIREEKMRNVYAADWEGYNGGTREAEAAMEAGAAWGSERRWRVLLCGTSVGAEQALSH